MKPALCQFYGRDFDSSQGVRAHLRFCPTIGTCVSSCLGKASLGKTPSLRHRA